MTKFNSMINSEDKGGMAALLANAAQMDIEKPVEACSLDNPECESCSG